jgi:hypothetical protein
MFGAPAAVLVVLQMALLANGFEVKAAMAVGILACVLWLIHAAIKKDKWLAATNAVVMLYAIQGVLS